MVILTKKYRLSSRKFVWIAFKNLIRHYFWYLWLPMLIGGGVIYLWPAYYPVWIGLILFFYILIGGVTWAQLHHITTLEQQRFLFEPLTYRLSAQHILLQPNPKQGIPLDWEQIKRVSKRSEGYYLFMSPASFIFLPTHIFEGTHQTRLFDALLYRKGLLK